MFLCAVLIGVAGMYVVARLLLGFGIPFCIVAGSSLIGELGYPKERAILTSLFNSSYFIGQIIAAAVGLGTVTITTDWAWRIPSLLQIAPALIQITFVLYAKPLPCSLYTSLISAASCLKVHDTWLVRTDTTMRTKFLLNTTPKGIADRSLSKRRWPRSRSRSNWRWRRPGRAGWMCSEQPACVDVCLFLLSSVFSPSGLAIH